MKLQDWTEADAMATGDFREDMTHERHLATVIVDGFEDFLDQLGVRVPDAERDANVSEGEANLYGEQYERLVDNVEWMIATKLESLENNP